MRQNRLNILPVRFIKHTALFVLPFAGGLARVAACAAMLVFLQCTNTYDQPVVVEICKNCLPRKVRQSDHNTKTVEPAICHCPASGHLPGCAAVNFFPEQKHPGKLIPH